MLIACSSTLNKKFISHYSHFHFIALCVNNREEGSDRDELFSSSFLFFSISLWYIGTLSYNNVLALNREMMWGYLYEEGLHLLLILCFHVNYFQQPFAVFHVCRVFATEKNYVTTPESDWFLATKMNEG